MINFQFINPLLVSVPPPFFQYQYKRRHVINSLCGITVLMLLTACGQPAQPAPGAGGPPGGMALPVTAIDVQAQAVPITLEVVGQTEGSKDVEVRARVSGIMNRKLYTEGDTVKAGTVLFMIDPVPYESALVQARALLVQVMNTP